MQIEATFADLKIADRFEIPSLPFRNTAGFDLIFERREGRKVIDLARGTPYHWPKEHDDRAVVIVHRPNK